MLQGLLDAHHLLRVELFSLRTGFHAAAAERVASHELLRVFVDEVQGALAQHVAQRARVAATRHIQVHEIQYNEFVYYLSTCMYMYVPSVDEKNMSFSSLV